MIRGWFRLMQMIEEVGTVITISKEMFWEWNPCAFRHYVTQVTGEEGKTPEAMGADMPDHQRTVKAPQKFFYIKALVVVMSSLQHVQLHHV
jgi:hypothetical protein